MKTQGPDHSTATVTIWSLLISVAMCADGCNWGCARDTHPPLSNSPTSARYSDIHATESDTHATPPASTSPNTSASFAEDPRRLTLVLADPRLSDVRVAWEAEQATNAAQLLQNAIDRYQPSGHEKARWAFLLGKMLGAAGQNSAAADQFNTAASDQSWPLADRARLESAEQCMHAGKYDCAVSRADSVAKSVPPNASLADRALLVRAEALYAMGDIGSSLAIYRTRLNQLPTNYRWEKGSVLISRELLEQPHRETNIVEALQRLRRVMSEHPGTAASREASELEAIAIAKLDPATRSQHERWPPAISLRRIQTIAEKGRRSEALRDIDAVLSAMPASEAESDVACAASALKAKLQSQAKSTRSASAVTYTDAIRRCEQHKSDLAVVLYSAAKTMSQVGRLEQSLALFKRVEKEFPSHRLADDARLRGAHVAMLMNNEPEFETMLASMSTDYPDGDMIEDGMFELALHYIGKGEWGRASSILTESTQVRPREKHIWDSGRALYYLGRAHESLGRKREALASFRQVVILHPLSFYMILAYERLRAHSQEQSDEALRDAEKQSQRDAEKHGAYLDPQSALPTQLLAPAFVRSVELLRLSETSDAREEVQSLGLGSGDALLTVAQIYARAGQTRLAYQIALSRTKDWSASYPTGLWRNAWEIAYPPMYQDIVTREAAASKIPSHLAYGIMREESAFDASAVSSSNAFGLMQLIMPTATTVAKGLGMKIDEGSLKRPDVNIKLGCRFLGSLRESFPNAPSLAIPSYNAGPGATRRWLNDRSLNEYDLWVERIPYEETRNYTKRVLSSVAVYSYLYMRVDLNSALRLP